MPVLSVKFTFKQLVKNNDYGIFFFFFFVFTLVIFLELETKEEYIAQRVYLHIWAAAGDKLTVIGTRAQGFILSIIS